MPFKRKLKEQKRCTQDHGSDQKSHLRAPLPNLRGANGQRHSQAAPDQYRGIQRAEFHFEQMASDFERRQVKRAINNVAGEQSAEEHKFGQQKYPHAEASGLALLLHVFKLVRESRGMRVVDGHVSHESPCCERSHKHLRLPRESPRNFQWAAAMAWSIPAPWHPTDSGQPRGRSALTMSGR